MTTQQGYSDYPMTMAHPNFRPSVPQPIPGTEIYNGNGEVLRRDYRGTPQMMPPVTVKDEAEEEYYRAQGYERAGKVDPSAWVAAHSGPKMEDAAFQKYPKWGRDENGEPVLYQTAADDPDAEAEDLAPPAISSTGSDAAAVPAVAPTELQNLQAQMASMNGVMQQMAALLQETKAENARLRAQTEAPEADSKTEGEDDTPAVSDAVPPRAKRPYNRKPK